MNRLHLDLLLLVLLLYVNRFFLHVHLVLSGLFDWRHDVLVHLNALPTMPIFSELV